MEEVRIGEGGGSDAETKKTETTCRSPAGLADLGTFAKDFPYTPWMYIVMGGHYYLLSNSLTNALIMHI